MTDLSLFKHWIRKKVSSLEKEAHFWRMSTKTRCLLMSLRLFKYFFLFSVHKIYNHKAQLLRLAFCNSVVLSRGIVFESPLCLWRELFEFNVLCMASLTLLSNHWLFLSCSHFHLILFSEEILQMLLSVDLSGWLFYAVKIKEMSSLTDTKKRKNILKGISLPWFLWYEMLLISITAESRKQCNMFIH